MKQKKKKREGEIAFSPALHIWYEGSLTVRGFGKPKHQS